MSIKFPFKRTVRQFADGTYANDGKSAYLLHLDYTQNPQHFVRPLFILQKDLQNLFDFVEPTDLNQLCFSYRIHELFIRCCIEVEANLNAILMENGYNKATDLNMDDYKKVNVSHLLSEYEVALPIWEGQCGTRKPFANWAIGKGLEWYKSYNKVKHQRNIEFAKANLSNLIDSICGLVAVLSAQFLTESFIPGNDYLLLDGEGNGMETAIGDYFRVRFPVFPEEMRYSFSYNEIKAPEFKIINFDYNSL